MRERRNSRGSRLGIQSLAGMPYRLLVRLLGPVEDGGAITLPGLQLSGSLMENWRCELRSKLTPKCSLLIYPPWAVAIFCTFPHLNSKAREETIYPKAQRTTGRGDVFQHLSSFISLSPLQPYGVISRPHSAFIPTTLHLLFPFYLSCTYSHLSNLFCNILPILQRHNKVNRLSCEVALKEIKKKFKHTGVNLGEKQTHRVIRKKWKQNQKERETDRGTIV